MTRLTGFRRHEDGDPDLGPVVRRLQQLYDRQRQIPDPRFTGELEARLRGRQAGQATAISLRSGESDGRRGMLRPPRRLISGFPAILSLALLFAIIGSLVAVIARNYGSENGQPDRTAGLVASSPTPITEQPGRGIKWQVPIEGGLSRFGGITLANDTLYRMYDDGVFNGVEALNTADGSLRWRTEIAWSSGTIAADSSGVYLNRGPVDGSGTQELVALDPADGAIRWSSPLLGQALHVITVDPRDLGEDGRIAYYGTGTTVIAQTVKETLDAFDPVLGKLKWQAPLSEGESPEDAARSQTPPVYASGMIFAISLSGAISAHYLYGGELAWSVTDENYADAFLTAISPVVVITQPVASSGNEPLILVRGLNLDDGVERWNVYGSGSVGRPNICYSGSGSNIKFDISIPVNVLEQGTNADSASPVPLSDGSPTRAMLMNLNPATGDERSHTPLPATVASLFSRLPGPFFGQCFAVLDDGTMIAVNLGAKGRDIQPLEYVPGVYGGQPFHLNEPIAAAPVAGGPGVFVVIADGTAIALDDSGVLSLDG
jgi:outer membrane protein assembly factor BamB